MAVNALLDCVEIEPPGGRAGAGVIWLHGLGASGHDFEPIVPELQLPESPPVRFVFPHAPNRPVTINNGMVMPSWFDITSLERLDGADGKGIEESVQQVFALIEREKQRGVAAGDIVLAGVSQGGVIALHAAARYPEPLAGVIAISTYMAGVEQLTRADQSANRNTPVFMAHGQYDPVIPYSVGELSRGLAQNLFTNIEWHSYPMEHAVCLEEIQAIGQWLRGVLKGSR
jgi:phospholipase/carboxylesterase